MSGQYLANISENAARLTERLQETFSERTRDLGLNRGGGGALLDLADDSKVKNIAKQLESSSDREKLDAMKRLVALISKGRNVSEYFAPVVKNVGSHNLEVRKLVYIYLLRYAEQEPDLALLSINTFQKDLNDSSPLIRAMALRVLSGIKVPSIGSIVVLAIRKCAADLSPYVRKAAALAIPKCHDLDSSHITSLIDIIANMLHERSPLSIGCVIVAFEAVCPTRLDLVHKEYRRLCRMLVDVEEWGQVDLVNLLLRYARTMLARPTFEGSEQDMDPDLLLLVRSVEPLLQSRNPAVVSAVVRVLYYVGVSSQQSKMVHPLLRLLTVSKQTERITLPYISFVCQRSPELFAPFYTLFVIRSDDLQCIKLEKIRLLRLVLNSENCQGILREFIEYQEDFDDVLVSEAIQAIGHCATRVPESLSLCINALTNMIKSPHDTIVSNAVLVLKRLVQIQMASLNTTTTTPSSSSSSSSIQSPVKIISHLARKLDDIHHPDARACVLWLVGQYANVESSPSSSRIPGFEGSGMAEWAPDVLRKATKSFVNEPSLVKLQILTLAAKLIILAPSPSPSSSSPNEQLSTLTLLCQYIFQLARYDADYDVRDRARLLFSLLSGCSPMGGGGGGGGVMGIDGGMGIEVRGGGGVILRKEQVRLVLFDGKSCEMRDLGKGLLFDPQFTLGSLNLITSKPSPHIDQIVVPDWLEHAVDSSFRETPLDDIRLQQQQQQQQQQQMQNVTAISSQQFNQRGPGGKTTTTRMMMSPVVLTPRTSSPSGDSSRGPAKSGYADLDSFYANEEEEGESEGEGDDDDDEDEEEDDSEEDSEEGEEDEGEENGEDGSVSSSGPSEEEEEEGDEDDETRHLRKDH